MVSSTVYVHGKEDVTPAAQSAARSIRNIREGVSDTIKPLKDMAISFREIAMLGGAGFVIRQAAQAIGQMQLAYEKMHPEAARAIGSLTNFNLAVDGVKATLGGVIDSALNPLREFFINLIDPMFAATQAFKDFNAQNDAMMAKYASPEYAAMKAYKNAIADQTATQALLDAELAKSGDLRAALNEATAAAAGIHEPGIFSGMATTIGASLLWDQAQTSIAEAKRALQNNDAEIAKNTITLQEQTKWLKANPSGGKPPAGPKPEEPLSISQGYRPRSNSWYEAIKDGFRTLKGSGFNKIDFSDNQWQSMITDLARAYREPLAQWQSIVTDLARAHPESQPTKRGFRGEKGSGGDKPESDAWFMNGLTDIAKQFTSLSLLMQPFNTILNAAVATLKPFVDTAMAPLVGALVVLGQTLGEILIPVINILTPVITLLAEIFVWLYNNVLLGFGNAVIMIANFIMRAGEWIHNLLDQLFNFSRNQVAYTDMNAGLLQPINLASLTATGMGATAAAGGYSSATTVQKPPDIYVYITVEGNVYGVNGSKQFAQYTIDAISDYLGTGARVKWLEN